MKKRLWILMLAGVLTFNQAGMVTFAQESTGQEQKAARGVVVTSENLEIGSAANSVLKFKVQDDEASYTKVYAYEVKVDGNRLDEGGDYILSSFEPGSYQPAEVTFIMLKEYKGIADRHIIIQLDTDGYGEYSTTIDVLQKGSGSGVEQTISDVKEVSREVLEDKSTKVVYEATGTAMDKVAVKASEPDSLYWMAPISVDSIGTAEKQTVTVTFNTEFGKAPEGSYKVRFYPNQNTNGAVYKEITTVIDPNATVVDKSALVEKIEEAKAIVKGNYTDASWNALQTAIRAALTVNDDAEATQETVDAQVEALEKAIVGLQEVVKNPVIWEITTQVTELESAGGIITVNVRGEDLPETLYYTLREKKSGEAYWTKIVTNKAISNPSETGGNFEIQIPENADSAATEWNVGFTTKSDSLYPDYMNGSITVKGKVPVLKDALRTAIADAKNYLTDDEGNVYVVGYTQESAEVLINAYKFAVGIEADDTAIQERVNEAIKALNDAMAGLVVDKEELGNYLEAVWEEDTEKYFTAESWSNYQNVIADAQEVYDDEDATVEEVRAAIDALDEAEQKLEYVLAEEADKAALKELIDKAEALNEKDYTADSWEELVRQLGAAKGAYDDPETEKFYVDVAIEALTDALDGLEAIPTTPPTDPTTPPTDPTTPPTDPTTPPVTPTPDKDKNTDKKDSKDNKAPKTADPASIALLALQGALAAGAGATVLKRRKKDEE